METYSLTLLIYAHTYYKDSFNVLIIELMNQIQYRNIKWYIKSSTYYQKIIPICACIRVYDGVYATCCLLLYIANIG